MIYNFLFNAQIDNKVHNTEKTIPVNLAGTKKLQNLFVNLKIPREERNYIDVVAAGSTVLFWSGGMSGASAAAPVTDDTKTVVCIELLESV